MAFRVSNYWDRSSSFCLFLFFGAFGNRCNASELVISGKGQELKPNLHCPSCGRKDGTGPDHVKPVSYIGMKWCSSYAAIGYVNGKPYVEQPSPRLMAEGPINDALDIWQDCYSMIIKKRILKAKAKTEIQSAWAK